MPLLPGKENIGANIRELSGTRPRKQAIAIALNESRKEKHPENQGRYMGLHQRGRSGMKGSRLPNLAKYGME